MTVHIFIAAKITKVGPTCWLWEWNQGKVCGTGRKWSSRWHRPDTGEGEELVTTKLWAQGRGKRVCKREDGDLRWR